MIPKDLIEQAINATKNAYSPYSNYCVGAALLTENGKVYTGCNVENHGIMAICSERVAFLKAISEGERKFKCIAVVACKRGEAIESTTPCGYCRQFISEFVDKDFKIYTLEGKDIKEYTIEQLLPESFKI